MKELSLMYLLNLAWHRFFVLITAFIVFAGVTFGYCEFVADPAFTAKSSILLTNGGTLISSSEDDEAISNNDIVASINMMETYIDFLKEPEIYSRLSTELSSRYSDMDYSWNTLRNKASIDVRSDRSLFIDIKFNAGTPEEAIILANNFAELTPEYFAQTFPYATVSVTSKAETASKTYPRTATSMIIAGLVGAVLAFALVLLIDSLDQAITGEESYTSRFDIPLLGTVPYFESSTGSTYYGYGEYKEGYGSGK